MLVLYVINVVRASGQANVNVLQKSSFSQFASSNSVPSNSNCEKEVVVLSSTIV